MKADLATIGPEATLKARRCVGPKRAALNRAVTDPMLVFDTQLLLQSRNLSYVMTGGSIMPRPLTVLKPSPAEVRQLQQVLEADDSTAAQRRRAEILLFYSHGWNAIAIATSLSLHANADYRRWSADLSMQRVPGPWCPRILVREAVRVEAEATDGERWSRPSPLRHRSNR